MPFGISAMIGYLSFGKSDVINDTILAFAQWPCAVHPCHSHMLRHACGFKLANDGHPISAAADHVRSPLNTAPMSKINSPSRAAAALPNTVLSECRSHQAKCARSPGCFLVTEKGALRPLFLTL
jgi:hypothetical protein